MIQSGASSDIRSIHTPPSGVPDKKENGEYIHGGNPHKDMERLGVQAGRVLDFSVNINPLGPPENILNEWPSLYKYAGVYPETYAGGVSSFYKARFNIPEESVLPGNGSIDLLYHTLRTLPIKNIGIFTPSFHDYERAAKVNGLNVLRSPLRRSKNSFEISNEQLDEIMDSVDAVIIGQPNNPTGTFVSPSLVSNLAGRRPEKLFIMDEAFIQFTENCGLNTHIKPELLRPNLIILHSLTKFYAIPGLRAGALISAPATVQFLKSHKEPWAVNSIAEEVARLLPDTKEYEENTRRLISSERIRMAKELNSIKQIDIYETGANFFLARWGKTEQLDDLLKPLLKNGVYVRDCRNFAGLEDNYFRFCIRNPEENDILIQNLRDIAGA